MSKEKEIPLKRKILYLMLLGMFPLIMVFLYFVIAQNELTEIENMLQVVQHQSQIIERKQALNIAVRHHYRDADHFYIDKHLETMPLLENEVEGLQKVMSQSNFAENETMKKRLEFLIHTNNLMFSEGVVHSFPTFQETLESLVHPVEVNVPDIRKILARVEGIEVGNAQPGPNRPQMLITDFKLEKKKINDKNEVFLLDMKLLKREFL